MDVYFRDYSGVLQANVAIEMPTIQNSAKSKKTTIQGFCAVEVCIFIDVYFILVNFLGRQTLF
jgi:hypothetical protein